MENEDSIKTRLLNTIDNFYKTCKLPPMDVSEKEWNNYLNIIEAHFLNHNKMDEFEHALNILIRRGLYFAKMRGDESFNINHLIKAVDDLCAFNIYSEEREKIKEEIKTACCKDIDNTQNIHSLLYQTITDECKKSDIKNPNISENDWLIAFDVIKTHYLANNIMNYYQSDLKYYIASVICWANVKKDNSNKQLYGFAIDSLYHIVDSIELGSIAEEIEERINKLQNNKNNKKYIKQ